MCTLNKYNVLMVECLVEMSRGNGEKVEPIQSPVNNCSLPIFDNTSRQSLTSSFGCQNLNCNAIGHQLESENIPKSIISGCERMKR